MPWAASGRAIAAPTVRPNAFTVTGTMPAPPQTYVVAPAGATAIAVGLSGTETALPGWSVDALIGMTVLLEKLPTNSWPAATANVCGPGPTAIGAPACNVD